MARFYITSSGNERNTGVHQILQILSPTTARISYRGLRVDKLQPFRCSYIVALDPACATGAGTLEYSVALIGGARKFRWRAFGDSYGALVLVLPATQYVRVYSNNGTYIDILVDYNNMMSVIGTYTTTINVSKFVSYTKQAADTIGVWNSGEQATITQVDNTNPQVWHLESPLVGNYDSGMTVYLARTLPLVDAKQSVGELFSEIDQAYAPAAPTSDTDLVAIGGSGFGLPDGWLETTGNSASVYQTADAVFNKTAMMVYSPLIATDIQLEHGVPLLSNMVGLIHTFKVWMRNINSDPAAPINAYLGFNFGAGWIESSMFTILNVDATVRQPQLMSFSQVVPPGITSVKVRIRVSVGSNEKFILDRAVLENSFIALFLGNNTIPRSQGRSTFGSLMYVWGADEISTAELADLGIPNIVYPAGRGGLAVGRIREAHNALESVDIFDITDVIGGNVVNVRGHITDVEWALAALTNLETITRIPSRLSYVKPTTINFRSETLNVDPSGPFTAPLSIVSDQDQQKAIIYANNIPIPITEWQFNSSTQIEIISGFNPTYVYSIEYNALIRAETLPIDILAIPSGAEDTWFADYVAWNRQVSNIATLQGSVSLIFAPDFTAKLPRRSDQNKLKSVLTEDTGINKRAVPYNSWDYADSLTIRINGAEFNPNAIYSFEYNQRFVSPDRATSILAEVRSAATVFSLSTTTYRTFDPHTNSAVNGSLRYHQIRLTVNGVTDLRDVRIHSALVKGLRLNTSPVVPGI